MDKNHKTMIIFIALVLVVTSGYLIAQSTQNATGTLQVSTPPSVDSIELFDDDNGGTTTPTTTLTPMDEMTLRINLSDPDGLDTLVQLKIVLYHSSTTVDAADDPALHVTIIWSAASGWSISPTSTWSLDTLNSNVPTTGTSGSAIVVFTPGKVTRYSTAGEWTIYVEATENVSGTLQSGSNQLTNINANFYAELVLSSTTFDFGLVAPGCQNVSLANPSYINMTIIANGNFGIKITGDGWFDSGGTLVVNFTEFNSLLVDDDSAPVEGTETSLSPFWVRGANAVAAPQWSGFGPTTEDGTIVPLYLYVSLPTTIPPGSYTTSITIAVVAA